MLTRTRKFPTVKEARQRMRMYDRSLTKLAELGGEQDIPFEQAFSNLAHAYIRDKAPSLLDHELGFQLLDRNQENTKAIGIFGFKVGSHMLYVPVFFLQGDLKGHELLYIKNQDMFVPLKENWLNYILNRKPNILGEAVTRNTSLLGVRQPDLNRVRMSPWKYASAMPEWARDVMPKLAATALTDASAELDAWQDAFDLRKFCKQASLDALEMLVKMASKYPAVGQALLDHYGDLDFVSEAVKLAGQRLKEAGSVLTQGLPRPSVIGGSVLDERATLHPIKSGALKVITYDASQTTDLPEEITDEDREKLLKDELLIKDERGNDDISIPLRIRTEQKLFNPPETGVYYVITRAREFKKCLVVIHPVGPNGRKEFATCVRLDGDRDWINSHPSHIWCTSRVEGKEYDDWFNGLSDPSSLPTGSKRRYLLIGPGYHSNATLPFRVRSTLSSDTDKAYEVDFSTYVDYRHRRSLVGGHGYDDVCCSSSDGVGAWDLSYDSYDDGQRIHLDGKLGTRLRSSRGDVYVPKGYKLLPVEPEENDKDSDSDSPAAIGATGRSKTPPFQVGNLLDAELEIVTKTAALRMTADNVSATINGQTMSKRAAVIDLVVRHGFREDIARHLLKEAQTAKTNGRTFECRVKYALDPASMGDPYLMGGAPSAPGFADPQVGGSNVMGYSGPTQGPSEQYLPVQGLSNLVGNRSFYRPNDVPEPMDFGQIQRAVATGQKEVFDTSMINSMLKTVRDDSMIDRWLPDLIKGMDRLGRILFQFYWHGNQFADRYGKQDMAELEDTLRNSFEQMGDTILFLKQKTIEPYPEEDSVNLDLKSTASN